MSDFDALGPYATGGDSASGPVLGGDPARIVESFGRLLDEAEDAIVIVDRDGMIVLLNAEAERVGRRRREDLLGQPAEIALYGYATAVRVLMISSIQDIATRKHVNEELALAQERFRYAFQCSPIGMALSDLDRHYVQVNDAFCQIVGYPREQLLEMGLESITHPDDVERDGENLLAIRGAKQDSYVTEKRYIHASGDEVHVLVHVTLLRSPDGSPLSFLTHVQDITERKRHERQLEYLADHDALTGLLNRRAFNRELDSHAGLVARYGPVGSAMVIDLDQFKFVNDTLGHQAGDELISYASQLLASRLRSSDVLARLGGDEFGVLLPKAGSSDALVVADGLLKALREQPIELGSLQRTITASIGIASFEDSQGPGGDDVMVNADLAMYDAKDEGRDRAVLFGGAEHSEARTKGRVTWAQRIQEALAFDRLTLLAQPIVHLATGAVSTYELLLRMHDEHGGLIPPATFLLMAERLDLIKQLDKWVVANAIQMLAELDPGAEDVAFEVNVSSASMRDPELLGYIESELRAGAVDPNRMIFEITETATLAAMVMAREFGERLTEIGCRFALDDFGAGFGSFYYLKHLRFDLIKIDGDFVRNCASNPTDRLLITSIVEIARGLHTETVAEFVPDDPTVALLSKLGVDYGQGYHLGAPAPLAPQIAARKGPKREGPSSVKP
ncbi:MAG: putative bifunctional diguanylate cyclase/phosphodiesterase [Solirubrobacteraceae bacterium]